MSKRIVDRFEQDLRKQAKNVFETALVQLRGIQAEVGIALKADRTGLQDDDIWQKSILDMLHTWGDLMEDLRPIDHKLDQMSSDTAQKLAGHIEDMIREDSGMPSYQPFVAHRFTRAVPVIWRKNEEGRDTIAYSVAKIEMWLKAAEKWAQEGIALCR